MYYAGSSGGFYPEQYPGGPKDLVEIPDEYHLALLEGQTAGKVISPDEDGYPVLKDAPFRPPQVPAVVTMRQARLALHAAGLLSDVEAAINGLDEPQKTTSRIEWDFSGEVLRASPLVAMLGDALALDDADLDGLFLAADAL